MEKNQNFKEFTITRVIICPFHPKKSQEGKNCKDFTPKGWILLRIHPQRVKIAKNSPLKSKN